MKRFVLFSLCLLLLACGRNSRPEVTEQVVQTAIVQTQEAQPPEAQPPEVVISSTMPVVPPPPTITALPTPTATPAAAEATGPSGLGTDRMFSANFLGTQERDGVDVEIARVIVADKAATEAAFGFDYSQSPMFADTDTLVEIWFRTTNRTGQAMHVHPNEGTVTIGGETVSLAEWMGAGLAFGEVGGELAPGASTSGGLWFGLDQATVPEIQRMVVTVPPPHTLDEEEGSGEGYTFEIDLSEHQWVPLPPELQ